MASNGLGTEPIGCHPSLLDLGWMMTIPKTMLNQPPHHHSKRCSPWIISRWIHLEFGISDSRWFSTAGQWIIILNRGSQCHKSLNHQQVCRRLKFPQHKMAINQIKACETPRPCFASLLLWPAPGKRDNVTVSKLRPKKEKHPIHHLESLVTSNNWSTKSWPLEVKDHVHIHSLSSPAPDTFTRAPSVAAFTR